MTEQQERRVKQLCAIWEHKSTEELLAVWEKNDRTEWTDDTFEVIRQILISRVGDLPLQAEHIPNNNNTAGSNPLARIAAYLGARRRKAIVSIAIIGLILLCGYMFADAAWRNSECELSPSNLVRRVSIEEVETGSALKGAPDWEVLKVKMSFIDELWLFEV